MLTAAEFHMQEPVPLHEIHRVVLEFCRGRKDIAVFGAQAVNQYVDEPRMTQDVDLMARDPRAVAEEVARLLQSRLHVAARVREVREGVGYRVYQTRRDGRRHLVDVRLADTAMDDVVVRDGIRYIGIPTTIALKVRAYAARRLAPKGATDLADLRRLVLAHPHLRSETGAVTNALARLEADEGAFTAWREIVTSEIVSDEESDEGY